MTRSFFKGPFVHPFLSKKIIKKKKEDQLQLWARSSTITPNSIDHDWLIHNGCRFIKLQVTEDMIGHKYGEFALTRKRGAPKKKKVKKR